MENVNESGGGVGGCASNGGDVGGFMSGGSGVVGCVNGGGDVGRCASSGGDVGKCVSGDSDVVGCVSVRGGVGECASSGGDMGGCMSSGGSNVVACVSGGGVMGGCVSGGGGVRGCVSGDGDGGVGVFEEYLTSLLPHNAAWLAKAPPWCSNLALSNETVLANTKAWAERRASWTEVDICAPMRISVSEVYGRHLVATRDLRAGEMILLEPPLLLALRAKSAPYCSNCFKRAQNFSCPECGFFFCGADCITAEHRLECGILQRLGLTASHENRHHEESLINDRLSKLSPEQRAQAETLLQQSLSASEHQRRLEVLGHYVVLATVRTLVAMENNPLTKRLIFALQGHVNQSLQRYKVNQKNIVDVVVQRLGAANNTELVHRICSVWDTNAFDVPLGWGTRVHGLYPMSSLLTHNCRANTQQWFTAEGHLLLRTVQHVPAGAIITTCYTDPQWATLLRQDHLRVSKHFTCTCERCQDATELGTFLGSSQCAGCGAPLVSSQPLDPTAVWVCHGGCPQTATAKEVAGLGAKIGRSIGGMDGQDPVALISLARQLQQHLHPTHHVLIRLHVSTLNTIVNTDLRLMSDEELETVWAIASLVSGVVKRLEAPLTRLSVRVGREVVRLQLERLRRGRMMTGEATDVIKGLSEQVNECGLVLGWDSRMPDFTDVVQEYAALTHTINH